MPVFLLLANSSPTPVEKKAVNGIGLSAAPVVVRDKSSSDSAQLYDVWDLESAGISKDAFEKAKKGYAVLSSKHILHNNNLLTIIDFSKPSSQKRLFVLDMATGKLLFKSLVAHGRNSGYDYATDFSNSDQSHKSSLGFFVTLNTYTGENGYSLKLMGCEKGINDRAYNRAIVLHGADYVSENFIRSNGYLGRSYGCPAVPTALSKKIIDVIKNGTCMFLYYPSKKYIAQSKILNS